MGRESGEEQERERERTRVGEQEAQQRARETEHSRIENALRNEAGKITGARHANHNSQREQESPSNQTTNRDRNREREIAGTGDSAYWHQGVSQTEYAKLRTKSRRIESHCNGLTE